MNKKQNVYGVGEINKRMYNLYYVVFESLFYVFGFNDVASYPWLTAGILSIMAAGSVCVERPTVGGGLQVESLG